MPNPRFKNCKACGRNEREVGPLSWTRLCGDCGKARFAANDDAMVNRSGPEFEHWARRMLLAANAALIQAERARLPDD